MKAAVVHRFDQGPRYGTFELPAESEGVLVDVLAAALSPRVRSGASGSHYTSKDVLPLVPGIDGVGRLPDGRRVYFIAASDTVGTMAERTFAHPRLCVPIPDGVDAAVVAATMLPAISSWAALVKRASFTKDQRVLVLGATGTSGQLAVQIAKHLGASEVIAVGRDAAALERTRALGADRVVQLTGTGADGDAIAHAASEVDVVLDYLWGNVATAALPAICRARRDEARPLSWVIIGSVAGDEITLSSELLRKRNLFIFGSGQGSLSTADLFSVAPDIVAAIASGALQSTSRTVPLAELETWWSAKLPSAERLVFVP